MPKFSYSVAGHTPAATPTDILTIRAPRNSTLRVRRLRVSGLATTAGSMPVTLLKRTATDTGGTSTAPAVGEREESGTDSDAVVTLYTANPTGLGTAGDIQFAGRLFFNLVGSPHDVLHKEWDADDGPILAPGEYLALNLTGAAVPAGGLIDVEIEWEE